MGGGDGWGEGSGGGRKWIQLYLNNNNRRENKIKQNLLYLILKKLFEQWKKVSIDVLHQMESTLKVIEVQTCKNKYTIF